ncbi:HAD family hydrolase [Allokutzneria sp. NRRL B-24872]|uniref:HAD family hydrolase n=1 Tax=Allokutzneria sp. NRRL B-24872 TaxID=1137961 RepID=UPI000A381D40|nr:haloacid dehalogenase-like hydrolase [Allokutzneria sp. NRRL B-24872]
MSPTRLVLWDIDLTLVELRGLGMHWYRRALATATGTELVHEPPTAGRTERWISTEILAAHGLPTDDASVRGLFAALTEAVEADLDVLPVRGRALPGAVEALEALALRADVVQGLVTGNLVEIAKHKLGAFGLDRRLDLAIGGYGDASLVRADLVAAAVEAATTRHTNGFAADAVIVFGDSPHDITAARQHGAVAVGVATGHSSASELSAAGADVVLTDLADTAAVLELLG